MAFFPKTVLASLFILGWCNLSFSQSKENVLPATHLQDKTPSEAETITFGRSESRVGDRIGQAILFEIGMTTQTFKSKKLEQKDVTNMKREQRRILEALAVRDGQVVEAKVTFELASVTMKANDQPEAKDRQPNTGKTYHVRRLEDDSLSIKDMEGKLPPIAEYEAVHLSMESLGRPNPLSQFLQGKKLSIGEKVALPKEAAGELLGVFDQSGAVNEFNLTLKEMRNIEGKKFAVFVVGVQANSNTGVQSSFQFQGEILIDPETCRTRTLRIEGPVALGQSQLVDGEQVIVNATGKVTIAMASQYQAK